jgi:tetratricopeptide (TPR) repeat protein
MEEIGQKNVELARHYLAVQRPERALEALARAGGAGVEEPDYWRIRAAAVLNLKRWDEAIETARSGLALDPHSVTLLDVLALAELESGHAAAAQEAIGAALEVAPEHSTLLAHKALILARFDRFEEAERMVQEALRVDPRSPVVLRVRTQVAYLRGHHAEAERYAQELLEVQPDSDLSHRLRGNIAVKTKRYKHARRHFEEAARLNPEYPEIADVVLESRVAAHPLLAPVRTMRRFGRLRVWILVLVLGAILRAAGSNSARVVLALIWLTIVVLSWVGPPLLRRYYRRRRGF